jgi:hypothetical protein
MLTRTQRTLCRVLVVLAAWSVLDSPAPQAQTTSDSRDLTIDDQFTRLNDLVPSFGGLFLDYDRGLLFAYSTDLSADVVPAFRRGIAEVFGRTELDRYALAVLPGRFTFRQLRTWHDLARAEVLGLPGVVLLDTDDRANRLSIGVTDSTAGAIAQRRLAALGVPSDAIVIVQAEPATPLTSLTDYYRPLVGGLQVHDWDSNGLCTLGLIVRLPTRGFVSTPRDYVLTNAHCTDTIGVVYGDLIAQPLTLSNLIAFESFDPPLWTGTHNSPYGTVVCPSGRRCRYADAALARLVDFDTEHLRGYIADPTGPTPTSFNGQTFRVLYTGLAWVGAPVMKVGRSTGKTKGVITASCADVGVTSSDILYLCQARTNFETAPGDSGSPTFSSVETLLGTPFLNFVYFRGLLWGGQVVDGKSTAAFSPIDNLHRQDELRSFASCSSPFVC